MPTGAAALHLATVAAMVVFLVWLWAQASERPLRAGVVTLALLAAWLAYAAAMALGGVTTRVDTLPPGGFLVLGPALAAIAIVLVALGRPRFRGVLDAMPLTALLLAQAFRVPVEIVLAMLAVGRADAQDHDLPRHQLRHPDGDHRADRPPGPQRAAGRGRYWPGTSRGWRWCSTWSARSILAFSGPTNVLKVTPPADYAMTFPMVWLPAFLVPVAMLLHGLAIMKLRRQERR